MKLEVRYIWVRLVVLLADETRQGRAFLEARPIEEVGQLFVAVAEDIGICWKRSSQRQRLQNDRKKSTLT